MLETEGYFMRQSSAGPIPDDIALCEGLFEPMKTSEGTLFDDMYIQNIDGIFQNRSKARRLIDLQPSSYHPPRINLSGEKKG